MLRVAIVVAIVSLAADAGPAAAATVRVGVLKFGTVDWVLDVMRRHGLDRQAGVVVEQTTLASNQATAVALQAGTVDIIVTDWLWVSRQRSAGRHFTFVPFSSAVGAVMVPPGSPIRRLADLEGVKMAVAGGPLDKSWLLLRGLTQRDAGFDPAAESMVFFGAPPLLEHKALEGAVAASLNYWTSCARLEARGFRRLIDVNQIADRLGAGGPVATIGYVFDEDWADRHATTVKAFLKAMAEAEAVMKTSDAEWQALQPLTGASDAATLEILRNRFRQGIPDRPIAAERRDAAALYRILAQIGGKRLVGTARTMAPGTYWSGLGDGS